MNRFVKRQSVLLLSLLGFSSLVSADDTEIYFYQAAENSTAKPNVLFIMDTSGSMDAEVVTSFPDYNPASSYGGSSNDYFYMYDTNYNYITRIHRNQANCPTLEASMNNSLTTPEVITRVAYRRNNNSWREVCGGNCQYNSGSNGSQVECETDYTGSAIDWDETTWNGNARFRDRIFVPSNYHDYLQNTSPVTARKTDIMIDAAKDLVDTVSNVNIGIMRFFGSDGGYVVSNFKDVDQAGNKEALKTTIDGLPASGNTPLVETMWEAMLFYRGMEPEWGVTWNGNYRGDSSVLGADGNYVSPITDQCQANYVVYLTDGVPVSDSSNNSDVSGLPGVGSCPGNGSSGSAASTCLDELAGWMFDNDMSNTYEGVQNVTTFTIGFDIDLELLDATATAGGGRYYTADGSLALKSAFTNILSQIEETEDTFVAPAVSVNAFNTLQHRNELYYALFKPAASPRWNGNLKRYQIQPDATIVDVNENNAVDPSTGYFKGTSRSWWSDITDGNTVSAGGVAGEMELQRKLYTFIGADPDNVDLRASADQSAADADTDPLTGVDTNPDTAFGVGNDLITHDLLGVAPGDDVARAEVLNWAVGFDIEGVNDDSFVHNYLTDVVHSQPVVVTYGGSEENPEDVVYYTDNLGFLHAIDTKTGRELWAFIPQELLGNPGSYYENDATATDKIYGLDGNLTVWRQESDDDDDVTIDPADGDHVYLYVNMRRGGGNYYAFDVTDGAPPTAAVPGRVQNPLLMWQITGGVGDFADMGQSWAAPRLGKIRWNCDDANGGGCEDKIVMFIAGGYDPVHDNALVPPGTAANPDAGNVVYMVDAETRRSAVVSGCGQG